jgi:hypothetical protein
MTQCYQSTASRLPTVANAMNDYVLYAASIKLYTRRVEMSAQSYYSHERCTCDVLHTLVPPQHRILVNSRPNFAPYMMQGV